MKTLTLSELCNLVDGRLEGEDLVISGAAIQRDAKGGDITLADGDRRNHRLDTCKAAAVIAPEGVETENLPTIRVDDVHDAFTKIVTQFQATPQRTSTGISNQASVSDSARLGKNVTVHPMAVIGDEVEIGDDTVIHSGVQVMTGCRIAENVTIFPGAVLYENTVVGPRCIIHGGAVIGAYGFGYKMEAGRFILSAQLGNVVIESDVEVGACTTIDRGTYGSTRIGEGTKIDNQVMVAHNCSIGKHNMLCSQVGIAGSTTTGDYVVMAGQVGVRDHVHIGNRAVIGAKGGVTNDVADDSRLIGSPAIPEMVLKRQIAAVTRLPEMRREFKKVLRAIEELKRRMGELDTDPPAESSDDG